jgi:arginase
MRRMARPALLDAPLDCSGAGRGEELAPAALRAAGLAARLGARDAGEADARIRDTRRDPETGVIGAADVRRASEAIAARVRELLDAGERPLVVGGDCTLLLGIFRALPRASGLWFVDGHADFYDGDSSPTGEAADMDLAILTGHGPPGLLAGDGPLLDPADVLLLGYPQPLGLDWDDLVALARPLVAAANLIGVSVADFNPERDPEGVHAARIVEALGALWA